VFDQYSYLYVEDDHLSREIMRMIMENGMGVRSLTIFEDSTDFLQRVQRLDKMPEVILLDIHVKPDTGFDMLRELRTLPAFKDCKIVALTASVMNEEVEQLRQSGFDGAIGKPLSVKTFPDLMARIIEGELVWHVA
jgi:CheY-like chemotaxis protein